MMEEYLGGALAFILTVVGIRLFLPVAHQFSLVDRFNAHKSHDGKTHETDIPFIGGLLMFSALAVTLLLTLQGAAGVEDINMILAGTGIVVLVGFIDDLWHMSVRLRLLAQVVASLLVALTAGCVLTDFGRLVSTEMLTLGAFSVPMTVFAITGGMNAMNMSDGLDGLAGGLALITLLSLLLIMLVTSDVAHMALLLAVVGATAGFLLFNFRWRRGTQAKVFMGDAGSMMLGFIITCMMIDLTMAPGRAMTPVTALWIFAVPLMDTFRLMIMRMLKGNSPFTAGRDHLHHLFLASGVSVRATVCIILAMQLLFSVIGLTGLFAGISERLMFFLALILFVTYFTVLFDMEKATARLRRLLAV